MKLIIYKKTIKFKNNQNKLRVSILSSNEKFRVNVCNDFSIRRYLHLSKY